MDISLAGGELQLSGSPLKFKENGEAVWNERAENLLKSLYPHRSNFELASIFNCSPKSIQKKASRMGLKKTEEQKVKHLRKYCFKKGQPGYWKGKKLPHRPAKMFEKGHNPWNKVPVGTVKLMRKRTGYKEYFIKYLDGRWRQLKIHKFLAYYGYVPKAGVHYKDGNMKNVRISNLTDKKPRKTYDYNFEVGEGVPVSLLRIVKRHGEKIKRVQLSEQGYCFILKNGYKSIESKKDVINFRTIKQGERFLAHYCKKN